MKSIVKVLLIVLFAVLITVNVISQSNIKKVFAQQRGQLQNDLPVFPILPDNTDNGHYVHTEVSPLHPYPEPDDHIILPQDHNIILPQDHR